MVYQHAGVEGIQAQALVDAKYDGIVTAGVGNGNLHKSTFPIIEKAAKDVMIKYFLLLIFKIFLIKIQTMI